MSRKNNDPISSIQDAAALIRATTTLTRSTALVSQIGTVRKGQAWTTPNRNTVVCTAAGGDRSMHAGIVAMACWAMDRLMLTNTTVALGIVARLPGALGNATGALNSDADGTYLRQQGRHYFAKVNILARPGDSLNSVLTTTAHEIVHCHQYHRGILRFHTALDAGHARSGYAWTGNAAYGRKGEYPMATLPEWSKRPWERHAMAMEKVLAAEYGAAGKELKDRQGDRYHRTSTPKADTLAKWEDALAAGTRNDDGTVTVSLANITAAGLGATWLRKMHGWLDGKTCQNAAHATGYHGVLSDHRTASPYVTLTAVSA